MYIIDKLELVHKTHKSQSIEYILSDYFLTHLADLRKLSLKMIAMETQLSHSSIIRFCQSAGFSGFIVFVEELQTEIDEMNNALLFYNRIDLIVYEDMRSIFMEQCQKIIAENVENMTNKIVNSQKILFYGHDYYLSCFHYLTNYLHYLKKDVINNMCWNKKNQKEFFDSLTKDDLLILIDPQKDYFNYTSTIFIHEDALQYIDQSQTTKLFIGQGSNDKDVDISLTLPYTYYQNFYKDFLIQLDMTLAMNVNKKCEEN